MDNKTKGLIVISILVAGLLLVQFEQWRTAEYPVKNAEEAQYEEEQASETVLKVEDNEDPLGDSPLSNEAKNEVAISYINSIVSDAFTRGTDNALKQIISFAQKTNEDGTIEPICDTITVGDIVLINTACLQAETNK